MLTLTKGIKMQVENTKQIGKLLNVVSHKTQHDKNIMLVMKGKNKRAKRSISEIESLLQEAELLAQRCNSLH